MMQWVRPAVTMFALVAQFTIAFVVLFWVMSVEADARPDALQAGMSIFGLTAPWTTAAFVWWFKARDEAKARVGLAPPAPSGLLPVPAGSPGDEPLPPAGQLPMPPR